MNMISSLNDTNFELYIQISDDEQKYFTPQEVDMYVQIYGGQKTFNKQTLQRTSKSYDLQPCSAVNVQLSDLTKEIQEGILSKKPHCFNKFNNYQLQGYDDSPIQQSVTIDVQRCQNSTNHTCLSDAVIDNWLETKQFTVYSLQRKIDFQVKNSAPVYVEFIQMAQEVINPKQQRELKMFLRKNVAYVYESWLGSLGESMNYTFFDISMFQNQRYFSQRGSRNFIKFELLIDINAVHHSRKEYNFIDLMGDVGGIQNILTILCGWFFYRLSKFQMQVDAFNRIFVLDEKDRLDLFLQPRDQYEEVKPAAGQAKFAQKVKKTKVTETRFNIKQKIELFLLRQSFLFTSCINNGRQKRRFLEMTQDKIEEKLDFCLFFNNTRQIKHISETIMVDQPKKSEKEYIDVSSEDILDEQAEQNKNNDAVFDTEKLDQIGEIQSSHVSSDSLDVSANGAAHNESDRSYTPHITRSSLVDQSQIQITIDQINNSSSQHSVSQSKQKDDSSSDVQKKKRNSGGTGEKTQNSTNGKRNKNEQDIYKNYQDSFQGININESINPSSHGSNYDSVVELENIAFQQQQKSKNLKQNLKQSSKPTQNKVKAQKQKTPNDQSVISQSHFGDSMILVTEGNPNTKRKQNVQEHIKPAGARR